LVRPRRKGVTASQKNRENLRNLPQVKKGERKNDSKKAESQNTADSEGILGREALKRKRRVKKTLGLIINRAL